MIDCAQLHFNIYKKIRVKLDKQHCQEGKVTILWNQQVKTDRTIPNNKPDITIRDNEKETC